MEIEGNDNKIIDFFEEIEENNDNSERNSFKESSNEENPDGNYFLNYGNEKFKNNSINVIAKNQLSELMNIKFQKEMNEKSFIEEYKAEENKLDEVLEKKKNQIQKLEETKNMLKIRQNAEELFKFIQIYLDCDILKNINFCKHSNSDFLLSLILSTLDIEKINILLNLKKSVNFLSKIVKLMKFFRENFKFNKNCDQSIFKNIKNKEFGHLDSYKVFISLCKFLDIKARFIEILDFSVFKVKINFLKFGLINKIKLIKFS